MKSLQDTFEEVVTEITESPAREALNAAAQTVAEEAQKAADDLSALGAKEKSTTAEYVKTSKQAAEAAVIENTEKELITFKKEKATADVLSQFVNPELQSQLVSDILREGEELQQAQKEAEEYFEGDNIFLAKFKADLNNRVHGDPRGTVGLKLKDAQQQYLTARDRLQGVRQAAEDVSQINAKLVGTTSEALIAASAKRLKLVADAQAKAAELDAIRSGATTVRSILAARTSALDAAAKVYSAEEAEKAKVLTREAQRLQLEEIKNEKEKNASIKAYLEVGAAVFNMDTESFNSDVALDRLRNGTAEEKRRWSRVLQAGMSHSDNNPRGGIIGYTPGDALNSLLDVDPDGVLEQTPATKFLRDSYEDYLDKITRDPQASLPKNLDERKAGFNLFMEEKFKELEQEIKTGDSTNPYHAPPVDSVSSAESVKNTKWWKQTFESAPPTETNPEAMIDTTIARIGDDGYTIEEAAKGISNYFSVAKSINNSWQGGFYRVGLPVQEKYTVKFAAPKSFFERGMSNLTSSLFGDSKLSTIQSLIELGKMPANSANITAFGSIALGIDPLTTRESKGSKKQAVDLSNYSEVMQLLNQRYAAHLQVKSAAKAGSSK